MCTNQYDTAKKLDNGPELFNKWIIKKVTKLILRKDVSEPQYSFRWSRVNQIFCSLAELVG